MDFLKGNLWEIKKSTALQIFGGLLGAAHLLTYFYWHAAGDLPLQYHANPNPICWSLFESCGWVKFLSPTVMGALFYTFAGLSGLTVLLMFFTRLTGLGWFTLFLTLLLKALFYFQDLRLSGNLHYLLAVLTICYLFVPNKLHLLRWLFVSYYVASGLLMMSPNWLTGQFFIDQLHVHVKLGEWLAGITVLAQMLAPVALWFKDLRNFVLAMLTLILLHALQWYATGFFEPAVMLTLLVFFPLAYYEERKMEREYLYQSFIRPEPSKIWLIVGLTIFWSIQALPYLPQQNVQGLSHIEQAFALSPVAASNECQNTTFLVYEDRTEEVVLKAPADRPLAFACNPYLQYLDLKSLCAEKKGEAKFKTVMSYLHVRGLRDREFRPVFQVDDFCNENLTYAKLSGGASGT